MFKVGDEVFVKGEITEVIKDVPYPIRVKVCSTAVPLLFTEEEVITVRKTYEQGLADAWELAKKVLLGIKDGGFDSNSVMDIFGRAPYFVFKDFTAEEALAKIEAYEKENGIKVGNEVIDNDGVKACVLEQVTTDHFFVFTETGSVEDWSKGNFKKTGKHIDIESLLKEIGE